LRYTELNPVRAGLVARPEMWRWSSAAAHCGTTEPDWCLEMGTWRSRRDSMSWREYLAVQETEAELQAIRECTHTGRPLGTAEFVESLEQTLLRRLAPQKGGRRAKGTADDRQAALSFNE